MLLAPKIIRLLSHVLSITPAITGAFCRAFSAICYAREKQMIARHTIFFAIEASPLTAVVTSSPALLICSAEGSRRRSQAYPPRFSYTARHPSSAHGVTTPSRTCHLIVATDIATVINGFHSARHRFHATTLLRQFVARMRHASFAMKACYNRKRVLVNALENGE